MESPEQMIPRRTKKKKINNNDDDNKNKFKMLDDVRWCIIGIIHYHITVFTECSISVHDSRFRDHKFQRSACEEKR